MTTTPPEANSLSIAKQLGKGVRGVNDPPTRCPECGATRISPSERARRRAQRDVSRALRLQRIELQIARETVSECYRRADGDPIRYLREAKPFLDWFGPRWQRIADELAELRERLRRLWGRRP